jgi:hypothetical protein
VDSVQFIGPELLDGKPMFVYAYKTKVDLGNAVSNGNSKIWMGALDGRAYHIESDSESITAKGKMDHTTVTYEYDIPLTIEAPQ